MRDLLNNKQRFNESFTDYLTCWRGKLAQMRHKAAESDQLMLAMEGCVSTLSRKLKDLGIHNFEELHRFGVQKELDLVQEKRFFGGRFGNKDGVGSKSNVQINAIRQPGSGM